MCYLFHLDTEQNNCQNFYGEKIFLDKLNLQPPSIFLPDNRRIYEKEFEDKIRRLLEENENKHFSVADIFATSVWVEEIGGPVVW